jgi:hypothetical protein
MHIMNTWCCPLLMAVLFAASGCSSKQEPASRIAKLPPPELPEASDIVFMYLHHLKPGGCLIPCEVLRDDEYLGLVLDWLRQVDWSAHSDDIANRPAVGYIEFRVKGVETWRFLLVEGGVVHGKWACPADPNQVKAIFRKWGRSCQ